MMASRVNRVKHFSVEMLTRYIVNVNDQKGVTFKRAMMVWFKVFNATFHNISVISWQSVLLVQETRVPGERMGCGSFLK
jgi:hypothetical protein